jgi:putative transcriptional regulator
MSGLYWSGNINALKALIRTNLIKPHEVRFYIGYAGWDSGQLKKELKANTWLVGKYSSKEILHTMPSKIWSTFVNKLGRKYMLWNTFPVNPSDN